MAARSSSSRPTEPITEPFVTLLVEVNWARGRLVREYTMLLDPPVYTPGESAVASAPGRRAGHRRRARARDRSRARRRLRRLRLPRRRKPRRPPRHLPRPRQRRLRPMPAVRRRCPGERLSRQRRGRQPCRAARRDAVADRQRRGRRRREFRRRPAAGCSPSIRQPAAFDGNMNVLRSGAVLRIPDASDGCGDLSGRGVRRNPPPVRGLARRTPVPTAASRAARTPEAGHPV